MITEYTEISTAWQPGADGVPEESAARECERCAVYTAQIAALKAQLARTEQVLLLTDTRNQLRARSAH